MSENENKSKHLLYFSAFSMALTAFTSGTAFAWSSPSLPKLNGKIEPENNPLDEPLNKIQETLIASLICFGGIFGPFMAGFMSDRIGSKKSLLILTVPICINFILISIATEVWYFYVARSLCGISSAAVYVILPNYVAEIAEKNNRGKLSCFLTINATLGNLLTYLVGPYTSIRNTSLICLVAPTLFFIFVGLIVPESPYYLVAQGNKAAAKEVLLKLRQRSIKNELEEIEISVNNSSSAKKTNFLDLFKKRELIKRIVITFGLVTLQQLTGINAILFYLQSIFHEAGSTLSGDVSSIIIIIVQVLSAAGTPLVVDRLGRRFLLFFSAIGTTISLIFIGIYFHLKDTNGPYESITWLPILSLIVYIISFTVGFGPVPFTILGEIFPPNYKAAASTLTISLCYFFIFITTVFFPYLMTILGIAYSFWLFSIFSASSIIFIYFIVPETKGKTLMEIQNMIDK